MLADYLRAFTARYADLQEQAFRYSEDTDVLTKNIPDYLATKLNLSDNYVIRGSVGQGNWAETPWVAILDTRVTRSTQNGYYVCCLIDPSSASLYLCLAVGWTQFAAESSHKEARSQIQGYSEYLYSQLKHKPLGFVPGTIRLSGSGQLSKGYESGQILSKHYDVGELTEKALVGDLENLLECYEELTRLVGSDIKNIDYSKVVLNEKIDADDRAINKATLGRDSTEVLQELKKYINTVSPEKRTAVIKKSVRNPKIARLIKESKQYICEICGRLPFTQKNGRPYAEADHVKPLGQSGYDSADNMRCLCAQCHAVITHGSQEEVERLLAT